MELIKAILLKEENAEENQIPEKYSDKEVLYHIGLCIEANLIHGQIFEDESMEIFSAVTWRLTWDGHEFLDAAKNSTVWNKTIAILKQGAIDVPFAVLKALLIKQLKEKTGLEI